MKHKSKSIKFFLVCVILLVVLFFAAVGYLTFLTASFAKSDGQPSNTQQIVSISDDGTVNVTTEDVIKNRLYKIKVVAFILSGMMIFDIMLMIFYFWIRYIVCRLALSTQLGGTYLSVFSRQRLYA